MGPLLLLASTLFSCWTMMGAYTPPTFTIRSVTLAVEPAGPLPRDANATLRCRLSISALGSQTLRHTYTFYRDEVVLYTKTSDGPEQTYLLSQVRYSNTGKYRCRVNINGQSKESIPVKVAVTGVSVPILRLDKLSLTEGEEVTATCVAPGESGAMFFYFYADGKEVAEARGEADRVAARLRLDGVGTRQIHCDYTATLPPDSVRSNKSNQASVSVRELSVKPVLEFSPVQEIFEGDRLTISCKQVGYHPTAAEGRLSLTNGAQLLGVGSKQVNKTAAVFAKDSGEIECRLEVANTVKMDTKTLSVTELFSAPTLRVAPAELFQGERMQLFCSSTVLVAGRLRAQDITYAMGTEDGRPHLGRDATRFAGPVPDHHQNYTCSATARGIVKFSAPLLVRPKVSVAAPQISAVGRVILGRPVQVRCRSDRGSLPINYTLWNAHGAMNSTVVVSQPQQEALFTITVQKPQEVSSYTCEANNRKNKAVFSKSLNASVTVPLSKATLTVLSSPGDVSEGNTLILICGVVGTPPVTFKWYRTDRSDLLHDGTSNEVSMDHQIRDIRRNATGTYYCEAFNPAGTMVRSDLVAVDVGMALWKKGAIAASCLLVLCVAVLLCVLRFKSRRGKKEVTTELSVKPPSSQSDDSLAVSLTRDTEAYPPAAVTADRTTSSMWSVRPPTTGSDEEASVTSREPDVEYTEVVHPRPADPAKVVLKKGTETVYTELQTSPHGVAAAVAADPEYGSLQYAELNNAEPEVSWDHNHHHCLPVPVD